MNCPVDGTALVAAHAADVPHDYCPTCRGAWFARRALEQMVEFAGPNESSPAKNRPRRLLHTSDMRR
jgi:Zn-finger nucleic acid-binding protein